MDKNILLEGKVFGSWTVLSFLGKNKNKHLHYLCRCKCGNERKVEKTALVCGKSLRCNSCGHLRSEEFNVGQKIGRWTIIKRIEKISPIIYLCKCDCGTIKEVAKTSLTKKRSLSCGCLRKEKLSKKMTKHNKSKTKLYKVWYGIKERCLNSREVDYKYYGGRGIKMSDEWRNDFMAFYNWSMANGYKENLTIDRINNDGNYEPNNSRWVDRKKQANNTRRNHFFTYKNEKHTLSEWEEILGIKQSTLWYRIRKKMPLYKIFYNGELSRNGVDLL